MIAPRSIACYRAFSLLELVIVLIIMGVVAAFALSRVSTPTEDAALYATLVELRAAEDAVLRYHAEHLVWPPDRGPGTTPPGLDEYLPARFFARPTPLGGLYDWNNGWGSFTLSMSIHHPGHDLVVWTRFDELYDDGNLGTGNIRKVGSNLLLRLR